VAIAFGTTGAASALVGTGLDIRKLVSETMTCWASFAHSGVPAARGGVKWVPYEMRPAGLR
jgi:hypothetical protein